MRGEDHRSIGLMSESSAAQAHLVLADGTVLTGHGFGHRGAVIGEVVFNTGMTGYQEVLTDPSYDGQLVTFTYPELGNTGVNSDDQEADQPHARGVIARQLAPLHSNWRSQDSLEEWMRVPSGGGHRWCRYPCTGASPQGRWCDEWGDLQRRPTAP